MKLTPVDKYRNSIRIAVNKAASQEGVDIHHIVLTETEARGLMDEWINARYRDEDWKCFYIPNVVISEEKTVSALRAVDQTYTSEVVYGGERRIGQSHDNFSSFVREEYPKARDHWIEGRISLHYQPKGDNRSSIELRVARDKIPLPDTTKFKRLFKKVR